MGTAIVGILTGIGIISLIVGQTILPVQRSSLHTEAYNPDNALIDYFEDSLGKCNDNYYININTQSISNTGGSDWRQVCHNGTIPDYSLITATGSAIVRIDFTPKQDFAGQPLETASFFFVSKTTDNYKPYMVGNKIYFGSVRNYNFSNVIGQPVFISSVVPLSRTNNIPIYTLSNGNTYTYTDSELGFCRLNGTNYNYCSGNLPLNSSFNDNRLIYLGYRGFHIDLDKITNFDYKVYTNFDLVKYDSNQLMLNNKPVKESTYTKETTSHIFTTDTDILLQPNEYLQLFPKSINNVTSYGSKFTFYSDTAFYYHKSNFIDNNYTYTDAHIVSEISQIVGGFNWSAWTPVFTQEELNNNVSIQISPIDNLPLNIKLDSSAYYYIKRSENSSDYCLNGVCYSNNYNDIYEIISQLTATIHVNTPDLDTSDTILEELPNLAKGFKSSFVFIGSIFTTFFDSLNTELTNYFYILFALGLVILIITIFKN